MSLLLLLLLLSLVFSLLLFGGCCVAVPPRKMGCLCGAVHPRHSPVPISAFRRRHGQEPKDHARGNTGTTTTNLDDKKHLVKIVGVATSRLHLHDCLRSLELEKIRLREGALWSVPSLLVVTPSVVTIELFQDST